MESRADEAAALSDYDYTYNYAELPDTILLKIFQILNLTDRQSAACVCHSWSEVYQHPSLWDEIEVILRAAEDEEEASILFNVSSLEHQKAMLENVGRYFRDVTVVAIYLRTHFLTSDLHVLRAIYRNCNELDTLTIAVYGAHQIIKVIRFIIRPITTLQGLIPVHAIVLHLKRLRKFHLKSWPHKDPNGFTIITTLAMNDNIINLEEINLYWDLANANDTWACRILEIPEETEVSVCFDKFKCLTVFSTQLCILTDMVLSVFAKPRTKRLQKLKVLIAYQRGPGEFEKSPISNETWKAVRMQNPHLQVFFTFACQIQPNDLLAIFQPLIPVVSVYFMKYARSTPLCLESLATYYNESLEFYRDYSDSFDIDEDLARLAFKCTELSCLIHHGPIHQRTVLSIAEVVGQRLRYFDVLDAKICTSEIDPDEFGDETVIAMDEDGTYKLVQQELNKKTKEEKDRRGEKLMALYSKVSAAFGRNWRPSHAPSDEYFTV
ncbi:F-box/LRR-repeat protein 21-like [Glandiceps talaboti]